MSQQTDFSDATYEAYDYIMNTEKTYRILGDAVGLLLRGAERRRRRPETELGIPTTGTITILLSGGRRKWSNRAVEAVREAQRDFEKNFPDEGPQAWFYGMVNPIHVLAIALKQRDRWKETSR